jgi:hypothetical protein
MTHYTARTLLLVGISASLLVGCAAEKGDPPPVIAYDTDDFAPAAATEQSRSSPFPRHCRCLGS